MRVKEIYASRRVISEPCGGSNVLANPRADTDRECYYQNGSEDQRARVVVLSLGRVAYEESGALFVAVSV